MGALLESLRILQDIELQIVDIRRQLTAKQRSAKRQAAKRRVAEETLQAERDELRQAQIQMDDIDVDLKGRNANVSKLRDNLNTVKTNKEYAAVLSQLNNEKADVTRLETRAYQLMEAVEAKKKLVQEHEAAVEQEMRRLTDLEGQLGQSQNSFAGRLEVLEEERSKASSALDHKTLQLFNRLSERYEGEVMARVIQPYARRQEYLCDGCNMALAAERANALMTHDDVITCDNCGRILYIDKTT